jgi:hypothetical protein
MDGEKAVMVNPNSLRSWMKQTGEKDMPIFSNEVDAQTLAEWEFAFQLGEEIPAEKLKHSSMSKPYRNQRNHNDRWGGVSTPHSVQCKKCTALYPIWGKFCLSDKEECAACGYVYEFTDW